MNKKRKTILIAMVIIAVISAFGFSRIAGRFFPEKIFQKEAFFREITPAIREKMEILGEMTKDGNNETSSDSTTPSEELRKITEEAGKMVEQKISEEFTKYSGRQIARTIEKLSPEQIDEIKRQLCRPAE